MVQKFWSRKFHLALLGFAIISVALFSSKIDMGTFERLFIANLMYYGYTNLKSRPKDQDPNTK